MDVRIARPLGYSELGNRGNNEDSLYPDPQQTSTRQRWFLVCDGVGGAERGEIASKLAVTALDTYFHRNPVTVVTEAYVQQAVAHVEEQFNQYLTTNPQASGMATTMTMLYLHEAGATVAHIGDSRVYQIREGAIIWCTDDHSYVNELVKAGVLSPDEARKHPQRNIITRALQGGEKGVQPSVQLLNDLRPGDYFFLCSDGVLERVSDELLENTLRDRVDSNEQKMARLHGYSLGNTRDNFTAYLIQIEQVTGTVEARYQVAPPLYERSIIDADHGDAVTLINMPIPDAVKPVSAPEPPAPVSVPVAPVAEPATVRPVAPPVRPPVPRDPVRPTAPAPARRPESRRSSPWLTVVLLLIGVALVAGGWYFWQQYSRQTSDVPARTPVGAEPPTKKIIPSPPADEVGEDLTVLTEPTPTAGPPATASVGLPDPEPPTKAVVRTVGNKLTIEQDPDTKLFGLRTRNGKWLSEPRYAKIGDFTNGIAPVETSEGVKKYLTTDGNLFDEARPASNQRIAVLRDKKWGYLNMNGQVSNLPKYDKAGPFDEDGTAEVTLNGETFRINREGKRQKTGTKAASPTRKEPAGKRSA